MHLPLSRLERCAARTGLQIASNGIVLEPISFVVANPKKRDQLIWIPADESKTMSLFAELKKIGSMWGLEFESATYKVVPNLNYEIKFSLNGYESNTLNWCFNE